MGIIHTQTLEIRGLRRQVLLDYFISQSGNLVNQELIQGTGWEVTLGSEREICLGSLTLPVIHITFEAEKEIALAMIQAFRMRFLSAGG